MPSHPMVRVLLPFKRERHMTRLTAQDFQPEVLQLFDRYVHGDLSRRGFLDQATRIAGSGTAAAGLLAALSPQFAQAQQVAPTDARIQTRAGQEMPVALRRDGKAIGHLNPLGTQFMKHLS